jgi:exonuclease VII large subunit
MTEIINFSKRSIDLLNPKSKLARFKENIDDNLSKIESLYSMHLSEKQNLIKSYSSQIEQLSPFNVLERGYSIVRNKKGVVVKSKDDIYLEGKISITSANISYEADITNIDND